jgi:hypothetical protein
VVSRYEGRVARYEMWNEPNLVEFWKPKPSPKEYAALLRISHRSAKKAYPQAKVVFAGLSRNDAGYLNAYYSAAKRYPDATRRRYFFDVLGVHPYSDDRSPDRVDAKAVIDTSSGIKDHNFLGITRMKSTMDARGDAGKRIFLGEYGFSTTDTWMKAVPDYRRALYLKRAYEQARSLPYVEGMSWYYYRPSSTDGAEWSITDSDWNPSLTYRALAQATGAESTTAEVSLSAQQETISGIHEVVPAISGLSQESISGWELYVDGSLVGSHDQAPFDWDTRSVSNGTHSLMVAAYTEEGSVWASEPVSVSVSNAATGISVASLSTDASSHASGSLVKAEATLSATAPTAVDEIVFAVRLKGTDENHDFYSDRNYSIGTTSQTLTSEKVFYKPGNYVYWVAYYRDGSWHNLSPQKEFVVG